MVVARLRIKYSMVELPWSILTIQRMAMHMADQALFNGSDDNQTCNDWLS